jgi:transcriptional regulator with XRE-family HTH domain
MKKLLEGYGEFIKKHRLLSGFKSQRLLADKTGISHATISRIEHEIQKPEVKTLQILASVLESTNFMELMLVCGYWTEEDLLEDNPISLTSKDQNEQYSNALELVKDVHLDDEELLKDFDLKVDGRSLTKEEAQYIIACIRSLRGLKR